MLRTVLSRAVLFAAMVAFASSAVQATDIILAHQGRLLDAADVPISGTLTLTFRIFSVPTGGIALWTEVHPSVVVHDGLFTTSLGSVTALSVDVLSPIGEPNPPRWLEVQVSGDIISPRIVLQKVPQAASAVRVAGDISTGPGAVTISNESSITPGTIQLLATPDSAVHVMSSSTSSGTREINQRNLPSATVLNVYSNNMTGAESQWGTVVSPDSAEEVMSSRDGTSTLKIRKVTITPSSKINCTMTVDDDNDGNPETSLRDAASPSVAEIVVTKHQDAASVSLFRVAVSDDSVRKEMSLDDDGDNIPEGSFREASTPSVSEIVVTKSQDQSSTLFRTALYGDSLRKEMSLDEDGDNIPEGSFREASTPSVSEIVVTKSQDQSSTLFRTVLYGDSLRKEMSLDEDGDNIPEGYLREASTPSVSEIVVTKSQDQSSTLFRTALYGDSALSEISLDSDGDGHAGSQFTIQTRDQYGNMRLSTDPNDDGVPDFSSTTVVDSTKCEYKLQSGFIYATQPNAGMRVDSTGSGVTLEKNGFPTFSAESKSNETRVTVSARSDVDYMDESVSLRAISGNTLTPGSSSVSLVQDGGPGNSSSAQMFANLIDSYINLEDDGVSSFRASSSGGMELRSTSNTVACTIDRNGNQFLSNTLGVGVASSGHHIDVAGGAYCDGTNWVNASDRNAKENFERVDGEELLGKIENLDITRWNYKGDDAAKHIGPTAQDFKAAFEVGSDDKSISTIDPSGIALAAIKELSKQNRELKDQNAKLMKKLEDLAKKVEKLASEK